ncbi:MAG: hypothetical protein ACXVEF_18465 [Polyangiales bacterium]
MIQREREPGFTLPSPVEPSVSLGCVTEARDPEGTLTAIMGEHVDAQGRVVRHTSGTYQWDGRLWLDHDQVRAYDERGRILSVQDLLEKWTLSYDSLDLHVSSYGGKQLFHLDDTGLVAEHFYETAWSSTFDYRVAWLDDVRPLSFDTSSSSRTWLWDSEGFLEQTTIVSGDKSCTRQLLWSRTDRSLVVAARDALGRTRWSGTWSFDDEGRMIHSTSIVGGTRTEVAWSYTDGWSIQAYPSGATLRASAPCNYPPTREDFARASAGAMWSPPNEIRPTHLHPLPGALPLPDLLCSTAE